MALTDNLQAFWELDNVNDAHGSNTLTNIGSTTFAAAKVGNGADFVPASSQYLSIADNAALSTGNIDFTIQAWVKFDDLSATRVVLAKSDGVSATIEYGLWGDAGGNLNFRITAGGFTTLQWSSTISTATWYHIIAYHDAAADVIGLVVNDGTPVTTTTGGSTPLDDTQAFRIGVDDASTGRFMDGLVDQVGFWKRKLLGAEITQLYNSGNGLSYAAMSGGGGVGNLLAKVYHHRRRNQ